MSKRWGSLTPFKFTQWGKRIFTYPTNFHIRPNKTWQKRHQRRTTGRTAWCRRCHLWELRHWLTVAFKTRLARILRLHSKPRHLASRPFYILTDSNDAWQTLQRSCTGSYREWYATWPQVPCYTENYPYTENNSDHLKRDESWNISQKNNTSVLTSLILRHDLAMG